MYNNVALIEEFYKFIGERPHAKAQEFVGKGLDRGRTPRHLYALRIR